MLAWEEIKSLFIFLEPLKYISTDSLNQKPENVLLFKNKDPRYLEIVFLLSDLVASAETTQKRIEFLNNDHSSSFSSFDPIPHGIYSCNRDLESLVALNHLISKTLTENNFSLVIYISNGGKIMLNPEHFKGNDTKSTRILIFHFNYYYIFERFIEQILTFRNIKVMIIDSVLSLIWLQSDITFSDRYSLAINVAKLKKLSRNGCIVMLTSPNREKAISFMIDDHYFTN